MTVFIFAQAVYLMFASVYVCKETVEHVLLSMGETRGEGGHHHHHDLGHVVSVLFVVQSLTLYIELISLGF